MQKNLALVLMGLMFITSTCLPAATLPDITQASLDSMGVTYGTPQMSGFVFVEGRYLPPPYTVSRRGNAIFINRIQIEQPVAWSYFDSSAEASLPAKGPRALDDEASLTEPKNPEAVAAAESTPQKVASIDDLFSNDAGSAAPQPAKEPSTKKINSIDDLFGDDADDEPAVKPIPQKIRSINDLFGDDEDDGRLVGEKAPGRLNAIDDIFSDGDVAVARDAINTPSDNNSTAVKEMGPPQSKEELAAKKEILKKRLEDKRYAYESAIAKGELFFFGTSFSRINGNYGTGRTLLEVLPSALRYSRSPEDLMNRLQAGNVFFLDLSTCEALYRHKTTFPLLQQRLDKIKQLEALKAPKTE